MSKSYQDEAGAIGAKVREGEELNKSGDSLAQEMAAKSPIVQELIWKEIYQANAEHMEKTGMKTFPSKTQQMLNTITDDEWKEIYGLNQVQMETAEGKNFTSKGIIENSAPLNVVKGLVEEMRTTEPTQERKSRDSGVSLENLQNMPSEKLAAIYEKAGLNPKPIQESKLQKFKEHITDLTERIDSFIYDKAHFTGKSVKETFKSFKENVNNKIRGQKSVQPQTQRKSSEHSR